jgi:hypothetical protein
MICNLEIFSDSTPLLKNSIFEVDAATRYLAYGTFVRIELKQQENLNIAAELCNLISSI